MNNSGNFDFSNPGRHMDHEGVLVGLTPVMQDPIRLPDASLRNHWLILGRARTGKSTLVKHLLARKLALKAKGRDQGAVVVVDTHGGVTGGILKLMPPKVAANVRFLDFGRTGQMEGFNLLNPNLFPDQERAIDTFVETCRVLWPIPEGRCEDLLRHSLWLVSEFNRRHTKCSDEMLSALCLPALLELPSQTGQAVGDISTTSISLESVLPEVNEPRLQQWFNRFKNWDYDLRVKTAAPIQTHIGTYSINPRTAAILGTRNTSNAFADLLDKGLVVLVSIDVGSIGAVPSALLGGSIVSAFESALRGRGLPSAPNVEDCLLVCDDVGTVPGPNWKLLLDEMQKYGCNVILSAQSLAGDSEVERALDMILARNMGCVVGFQMDTRNARIIARQMADDRVTERHLVSLDPYQCFLRSYAEGWPHSVLPMKILPPPEWNLSREPQDKQGRP